MVLFADQEEEKRVVGDLYSLVLLECFELRCNLLIFLAVVNSHDLVGLIDTPVVLDVLFELTSQTSKHG